MSNIFLYNITGFDAMKHTYFFPALQHRNAISHYCNITYDIECNTSMMAMMSRSHAMSCAMLVRYSHLYLLWVLSAAVVMLHVCIAESMLDSIQVDAPLWGLAALGKGVLVICCCHLVARLSEMGHWPGVTRPSDDGPTSSVAAGKG